jgi:hypothetical protein
MSGELDFEGADAPLQIEDAVPDLWLGVTTHFFLIEADGKMFKVMVERSEVSVIKLT